MLYERGFASLTFFVASRVDDDFMIEDIVQETLSIAILGIDGLRDPNAFMAWTRTIALNLVRSRVRMDSGKAMHCVPFVEVELIIGCVDDVLMIDGIIARELLDCWSTLLTPTSLHLLLKNAVLGYSTRELAAEYGCDQVAVARRISRAKALLRDSDCHC
jgi:DNA-directed RNA polymerase specialized sigma24 family protein